MPTIAIVGAGAGMGLAIAKLFGSKGFQVALVARNPENLDKLVGELSAVGVSAAAFPADIIERDGLTQALHDAAAHFGGIDVLEYSPAAHTPADWFNPVIPSASTVADLQTQIEYNLYGAMAATHAVLPAMREAGAGTLLFTTGGGSINPIPMLGNVNAAQAALRNWTINLHNELAGTGVYVGHVAIGVWIGDGAPDGVPTAGADQIAPVYWNLHSSRDAAEHLFTV